MSNKKNINSQLFHSRYFYPFLLIVISFLFYGSILKNDYSLDDDIVITKNSLVKKGIKGIPEIFTSHYISNNKQSYEYRPFVLSSFALEYELFRENPFVSHLISILIYTLTGILFFFILKQIVSENNAYICYVVPLIFLIHPIHSEVVNNVKCRDELLFFFFSLLSLYLFLKYFERFKIVLLVFAFFSFSFSLMCKATAQLFVLLIPLTIFFFRPVKIRQILLSASVLLSALLLFNLLKSQMLMKEEVRVFEYYENPLFFSDLLMRIPASFYIALFYLKMLFWPHPLSFYYGYNNIKIAQWNNLEVYISIIVFVAAIIYSIRCYKKKEKIIAYAVLIIIISILPFSNLLTPVAGIVAERFAYTASFGFSILLGYLITFIYVKFLLMRKGILTLAILLFFACLAVAIQRNKDWKDLITLCKADISHLANSYNANALLGNTIASSNEISSSDYKLAEDCYLRAIEIYPHYYKTYNNLGVLYMKNKESLPLAYNYFIKAIEKNKQQYTSYINLAKYYYLQNNSLLQMDSCYALAFDLSENDIEVFIDYIQFNTNINNLPDAKFILNNAIERYPNESRLYLLCAQIGLKENNIEDVKYCYIKYMEINPVDKQVEAILKDILNK